MANKIIGNQYIYNGPGYLDSKIQPVESVEDLNKILLRQRFIGLTVTVLHPDGENSKPTDYWLVQDPNEEEGVLMWERKGPVSVDTNTPEYINVTKRGNAYYVDASGNLIESVNKLEEKVETLESGLTETSEMVVSEIKRVDDKNDEQDDRIDSISQWHIQKTVDSGHNITYYALVDGSGNTIGDTIDVTEEQYLENVEYISAATEQDHEIDEKVVIGEPYLKFTWKYGIITYVAIKDWVNDYFAGDGIEINHEHEISVKLSDEEKSKSKQESGFLNYLSLTSSGLSLNIMIEYEDN